MLRSKASAAPSAASDDIPAPSELATSAVHLLHRAGQCADEFFAGRLPPGAMTPRQFAVLRAVEVSLEPSQNDIVAATGIDRSTIADIARRLVERGWLQRRRTRRDARMYALKLTARGQAALRQAGPSSQATDDQLLAPLSPGERVQFLDALERIVAAARPLNGAATKANGEDHG